MEFGELALATDQWSGQYGEVVRGFRMERGSAPAVNPVRIRSEASNPQFAARHSDKGRTFRFRHLEGAGNELGNLYRGPSLIGFDLSQHGNRTSHALGKFLTREPAFVALLLQPLSERAHYDPLA